MKLFVNFASLCLCLFILIISSMTLCQSLSHDESEDKSEDEEFIKLILTEIESGEDKEEDVSPHSTRTKSVRNNKKTSRSEQVRNEVKNAIATLKKYAQWKGRWDFIKSSQQVVRESKAMIKNGQEPFVLEYKDPDDSATCGNLSSIGVKIISNAIKSGKDQDEIAAEISSQMNNKHGKYWHVLVSDGEHSTHNIHHDSFLVGNVGDMHITIFQSSSATTFDVILDARKKAKNKKEASILMKSMPSSMSDAVIENAIEVVKQTDNLSEISRQITNKISSKFKEHAWQTIIGPRKQKSFSFDVKHDLMLQFALDDIEITLFDSTVKSAHDMIVEARSLKPSKTRSSMDPSMKNHITNSVLEAIRLFDDQTAIADFITADLNDKYGKLWFAIISFGPSDFGLDKSSMKQTVKGDNINDGQLITLTIGEVRFHIYRVFRETNQERIISQARRISPRVLNNQMPNAMKLDALSVATEVLRTSNHLLQIASKIQQHFEQKYRDQWQVIVNLRENDVNANFRYQLRTFLNFLMGEIVVRIFKISCSNSTSILESFSQSTLIPSNTDDLTNSQTSNYTHKQLTQEEAISRARSATPEITDSQNLEQFKTHAMDTVEKALAKKKSFKEIASEIRKNFAENFEISSLFNYGFNWLPDMYWNCLVGFKDHYSMDNFLVSKQRYITIDVENIRVIIFQMGGFLCEEMLVESRGGKVIQRPHWILGHDVTPEMYKKAQKIASDLMDKSNNCTTLAESLTVKLQDEWSGFEVLASVGVSNSFQHACEDNMVKFYIGYISFRICL